MLTSLTAWLRRRTMDRTSHAMLRHLLDPKGDWTETNQMDSKSAYASRQWSLTSATSGVILRWEVSAFGDWRGYTLEVPGSEPKALYGPHKDIAVRAIKAIRRFRAKSKQDADLDALDEAMALHILKPLPKAAPASLIEGPSVIQKAHATRIIAKDTCWMGKRIVSYETITDQYVLSDGQRVCGREVRRSADQSLRWAMPAHIIAA